MRLIKKSVTENIYNTLTEGSFGDEVGFAEDADIEAMKDEFASKVVTMLGLQDYIADYITFDRFELHRGTSWTDSNPWMLVTMELPDDAVFELVEKDKVSYATAYQLNTNQDLTSYNCSIDIGRTSGRSSYFDVLCSLTMEPHYSYYSDLTEDQAKAIESDLAVETSSMEGNIVEVIKANYNDLLNIMLDNEYYEDEDLEESAESDGKILREPDMKRAKGSIKDWYTKNFPEDDLGAELPADVTFYDLFDALDSYRDVYELMAPADDSVVRERLFSELADIMGTDYDYVYNQWLKSVDNEKEETQADRVKKAFVKNDVLNYMWDNDIIIGAEYDHPEEYGEEHWNSLYKDAIKKAEEENNTDMVEKIKSLMTESADEDIIKKIKDEPMSEEDKKLLDQLVKAVDDGDMKTAYTIWFNVADYPDGLSEVEKYKQFKRMTDFYSAIPDEEVSKLEVYMKGVERDAYGDTGIDSKDTIMYKPEGRRVTFDELKAIMAQKIRDNKMGWVNTDSSTWDDEKVDREANNVAREEWFSAKRMNESTDEDLNKLKTELRSRAEDLKIKLDDQDLDKIVNNIKNKGFFIVNDIFTDDSDEYEWEQINMFLDNEIRNYIESGGKDLILSDIEAMVDGTGAQVVVEDIAEKAKSDELVNLVNSKNFKDKDEVIEFIETSDEVDALRNEDLEEAAKIKLTKFDWEDGLEDFEYYTDSDDDIYAKNIKSGRLYFCTGDGDPEVEIEDDSKYVLTEAAKPKKNKKEEEKRVIMQQGNVTCFKESDTKYLVFENENDNEVEYPDQDSAMEDFMNRVGIDPNAELTESVSRFKIRKRPIKESYGDIDPEEISPDAYLNIKDNGNGGMYVSTGIGDHTDLGSGNYTKIPDGEVSRLYKELRAKAKEKNVKVHDNFGENGAKNYDEVIPRYNADIDQDLKDLEPFKDRPLKRKELDAIRDITGRRDASGSSERQMKHRMSGEYGRLGDKLNGLKSRLNDLDEDGVKEIWIN